MFHKALWAMMILLLSPLVWAGPIEISADRLMVKNKAKLAIFEGHVRLAQDDFVLHCDRLEAFYNENHRLDHAKALGNVQMSQDGKKGKAKTAFLDQRKGRLTLKGDAVLEQKGGFIKGETIIHDLKSGDTKVLQGEGGKVELFLESEESITERRTNP